MRVEDVVGIHRLALHGGLSATLLLAVTLGSALVANPAANTVVPESQLGMGENPAAESVVPAADAAGLGADMMTTIIEAGMGQACIGARWVMCQVTSAGSLP